MASRSSRSNRSASQKSRSSASASQPPVRPDALLQADAPPQDGPLAPAPENVSRANAKQQNGAVAKVSTKGMARDKATSRNVAPSNPTETEPPLVTPRKASASAHTAPSRGPSSKAAASSSVAFGQGVAVEDKAVRDESQFWIIATVLLALGIALRQWQLEAFPYHPDEAIHAWYSDDFKNYVYDPTYHGPLLYNLVAAVMSVAGANDYTARLVPSLLGVGALALVIGPARKYLGERGALWSMGLLAISPVMVTYSRRILHDSLAVFLTLGAVLCFQATREYASNTKSGGLARIGVILCITLFLCTKANAFFIFAMLLAFWIAEQVAKTWKSPPKIWPFMPVGALALVAVTSHFTFRDQAVAETAKFASTEGGLKFACVVACGLVGLWILTGPRPQQQNGQAMPLTPQSLNEEAAEIAQVSAPRSFAVWPYAVGLFAAFWVFTFLYGRGWEWFTGNFHLSQSIAAAFAPGNFSDKMVLPEDGALTKMLKYWGNQQANPRLPGPHDYYIYLIALYELPIMLLALAGIWRACRERTPFTDLLIWWNVTSFALYSLANEKVPWLMTHLILPMALIGGWWLARAFEDIAQGRVKPVWRGALATGVALGAVYLVRGVSACNFEAAVNNHEPMFYAQDTEMFRDEMTRALKATENQPDLAKRGIWVDNGKHEGPDSTPLPDWSSATWPCAWYLRDGAYILRGSPVYWDRQANDNPANGEAPRVAITSEERWPLVKDLPKFRGWKTSVVEFFIWPRANFPALSPEAWFNFWLKRQVNPANGADGLLAPPGEWSSNKVLIATPPTAN